MESSQFNTEKIGQDLVGTLASCTLPGKRALVGILEDLLKGASAPDDPVAADIFIQDLLIKAWKRTLQRVQDFRARRSSRRLFRELSKKLYAQGVISQDQRFPVPPQHRRQLTAQIDKLAGARFSDYQTVVNAIVGELTGRGKTLMPAGLESDVYTWLVLLMVVSGMCCAAPFAVATRLTWADVSDDIRMPIRLPRNKREGWIWFGIPPLVRLVLLALKFRARKGADRVLPCDAALLSARTREIMTRLCNDHGLPIMFPLQLTYFVRLDLHQVLTNTQVGLLIGMFDYKPVPADQVLEVLADCERAMFCNGEDANLKDQPELPGPNLSAGDNSQSVRRQHRRSDPIPGLPIEQEIDDNLAAEYSRLADEIKPFVIEICRPHPSRRQKQSAQAWADSHVQQPDGSVSQPTQKVAWLVLWLLDMTHDRKLKPVTRATYWSVIFRQVPETGSDALNEFDQAYMERLLLDDLGNVNRGERAAWKRWWTFLESRGLPVKPMDWRRLKAGKKFAPVRVITDRTEAMIVDKLGATDLGRAAFLALNATLRIGEVCRLMASDFDFAGQPYVVIRRSKHGRNRRVSLKGWSPVRLDKLKNYQALRISEDVQALFLTDGDGEPLDPKDVSRKFKQFLQSHGLVCNDGASVDLHFHTLRSRKADKEVLVTNDVRYAALQSGHASPITTLEFYCHTLDLQAAAILKNSRRPINDPNLCMPLATLAALLGREPERAVQMVCEYNAARETKINLYKPGQLPDGERPRNRRGRSANYIQVVDAIALLQWANSKKGDCGERVSNG